MTDEIRNQIQKDASKYMVEHQRTELGISPRNGFYQGFQVGATHQHHIAFEQGYEQGLKDGYKEAMGDASIMLEDYRGCFSTYDLYMELKERFESLKK